MSPQPQAPAFEGLLYTVFQQLRQTSPGPGGLAIAFTSANPGEGVTHTIHALVAGLAREPGTRTLMADSRVLRQLRAAPAELPALCRALPAAGQTLYELASSTAPGPHSWEGSWEYRRDTIAELRRAFDYVLVDCPALREGNDLLSLAPFVDGIILIVEADRTRKDQVQHAEKAIAFARGKLIGTILNKRSYVVPEWIYRRL
jgi:hypothetical protein